MKIFCVIFIGTFIPLASYANTFINENNKWIIIVFAFVFFFLALVLAWIGFEGKRESKNRNLRLSEEDKSIVKKNQKLQEDIADLNQELLYKEKEIASKDEEIVSLKKEILELKRIALYKSSTKVDGVYKCDDNKEEKSNLRDKSNSFVSDSPFIYNELAVKNGYFVKAESEQTTYYRAWREKGELLFEFVNNDRTRKAINNRTIIIEPFCIKLETSKSPDASEEIETKTPGILNEDYTIRRKAEIIYK